MKANELRVSNFVGYNSDIIRIMSVKEHGYISGVLLSPDMTADEMEDWIRFGIRKDFSLEYDIISPIPLTEEWLLKFGFNQFPTGNFWDREDFWACYFNRDKTALLFDYLEWSVKYVHQLQNLYFALTGMELTINT